MRRDSQFSKLEVFMLGIVYGAQLMSVIYNNQPEGGNRRRAYFFSLLPQILIIYEIINNDV